MHRIIRILKWAIALAMAAAGAALADSRLFSVRTDQPGVSVNGAVHNGRALAIAGTGQGVTFFRIENPAGPVACLNALTFALSDGSSVARTIDFCARNWDITLALGGGGPPASGSIRITTDDPTAEIVGVYLGGRPANMTGRFGSSVDVALGPDQGGRGCARDLGVELSDGRRMARVVDVCAGGGVVIVPLIGPELPVTAAPGSQPALPVAEPQFPPPQPQGPQFVTNMEWFTSSGDGQASLDFGNRLTGAGEFTAVCQIGTGSASIILSRTSPEVAPGASVGVRFAAGTFNAAYAARGTAINQFSGRSHPELVVTTADPLWPALIRESALSITVGSGATFGLSLRGSAVQAREFLARCNPAPIAPPVLPPPPPPPPGVVGAVDFRCDDGSTLSAAFDGPSDSVTVFEGVGPPLVLTRIPSPQGARYVAAGAELFGLGEQITWQRGGGFIRNCTPR